MSQTSNTDLEGDNLPTARLAVTANDMMTEGARRRAIMDATLFMLCDAQQQHADKLTKCWTFARNVPVIQYKERVEPNVALISKQTERLLSGGLGRK